MKQTIKITLLFSLCLLVFTTCKKYEDGPLVSLKSKKSRILGTYVIEEIVKNDTDITFEYLSDSMGVRGIEIYTRETVTGREQMYISGGTNKLGESWSDVPVELSKDKKELFVFDSLPIPISYSWEITRLTDRNLWYILFHVDSSFNVDRYDVKLIKQKFK